jgi:hypothetical protein
MTKGKSENKKLTSFRLIDGFDWQVTRSRENASVITKQDSSELQYHVKRYHRRQPKIKVKL